MNAPLVKSPNPEVRKILLSESSKYLVWILTTNDAIDGRGMTEVLFDSPTILTISRNDIWFENGKNYDMRRRNVCIVWITVKV